MSRRTSRLVGCGLAAIAAFGPGLVELGRLSIEEWRLNRRLASLTHRQDQLIQRQTKVSSDATYVEGLIRSTFKVAQPGEYVVPVEETWDVSQVRARR